MDRIPQPDRPIVTARGQHLAIRAEGNADDPTIFGTGKQGEAPPVCRIPQPYVAAASWFASQAASCKDLTIGAKCYSLGQVRGIGRQFSTESSMCYVP